MKSSFVYCSSGFAIPKIYQKDLKSNDPYFDIAHVEELNDSTEYKKH